MTECHDTLFLMFLVVCEKIYCKPVKVCNGILYCSRLLKYLYVIIYFLCCDVLQRSCHLQSIVRALRQCAVLSGSLISYVIVAVMTKSSSIHVWSTLHDSLNVAVNQPAVSMPLH